jgi:hypothetical protein
MTHMIKRDKREGFLKREDEMVCGGHRISITFRSIDTFLTTEGCIFGQGGKDKVKPAAEPKSSAAPPRGAFPLPQSQQPTALSATATAALGCVLLATSRRYRSFFGVATVLAGAATLGLVYLQRCDVEAGNRGLGAAAETTVENAKDESEELLIAFGTENSECGFDWDLVYGGGFSNTAEMKIVPFCECERVGPET